MRRRPIANIAKSVEAPRPEPAAIPAVKPSAPRPRTLTIVHKLNTMRVYNLSHDHMCIGKKECGCVKITRRVQQIAPGTRIVGIKKTTILQPEPLTLGPRETRRGVSVDVLKCPEIQGAMLANPKRIVVIEE